MTRGLIYKDALIEKLESNAWNIDEWELPHDQVSAGLEANAMDRETVEGMPTVDAVEVIRCKDCKYSSPNREYGCRINSFADDIGKQMYADDFCSIAERKEE